MAACDISTELPPVAQVKLTLMQGIANRLAVRFGAGGKMGIWSRASQEISMTEHDICRLRAGKHERFSLERLVNVCDEIGVEITITAR